MILLSKRIGLGVLLLMLFPFLACNRDMHPNKTQSSTNNDNKDTPTVHQWTRKEIAPTPPMGWNSWNAFRTKISAKLIKEMADAMVSSGMKDAGYEYIIIDDGWMTKERDKNGHLVPDPKKFPNGMLPVIQYVHSLGLKFGIYSSAGPLTCQKLMGSYGHEKIDANTFAAWGVDYLKYDRCYFQNIVDRSNKEEYKNKCKVAYETMGKSLKETGRPIVYATSDDCFGSYKKDVPWSSTISNTHRFNGDIRDNWERMLYIVNKDADLWKYAGDGFWNDADMLEVGNTTVEPKREGISSEKMNWTEYKSHFSLWCMLASPLIAGNDLRDMSQKAIDILTNKEMISVNQDTLGKQGHRIENTDKYSIWTKELSDNRLAVAFLNKSKNSLSIKVGWDDLDLEGSRSVRDLWEHKDLGVYNKSFKSKMIPSHGVKVLLLTPIQD